jgi:predicted RNase H-like HicB family nuclease
MTQYFPIIVEQESNGAFCAWVAGLPGVYAAADTATAAKRGIRSARVAHLSAFRIGHAQPRAAIDGRRVSATVETRRRNRNAFP